MKKLEVFFKPLPFGADFISGSLPFPKSMPVLPSLSPLCCSVVSVFVPEGHGSDGGTAWVFGQLLAGSGWAAPGNTEAVSRGSRHGRALAEGDRSLRLKGTVGLPSLSEGLRPWHWVPRVFGADTTAPP